MLDYHPFNDVMKDDPFPIYKRLREESPVHYIEAFDSWALSRFEDIWSAGEDPLTYYSPGPSLNTAMLTRAADGAQEPDMEQFQSIFTINPPTHTMLRKALAKLYSPRGVSRFEEHVRGVARSCIQDALAKGRLDVIDDLGLHVSTQIALLLIGLPIEDAPRLAAIVRRFFTRIPGVEGMPPDALAASLELRDYLAEAVRERRKQGVAGDGHDALDVYLSFEPDGKPLSEQQLAAHLSILVVGGTETLPKVFAGGVIQLHRHPDQRAELAANPALIPAAFKEIARYEMPTQFLTRTVGRDHELRGQKLREGQGVLFLYRAANRDEAEFPDADRFDIHRQPPRILSFGHGTHVCLGQHAANLEAKVMFEELLGTLPEYDLDEDEVVPERSEFVAGYVSVPIHFEPR
jgi:cytochrome P450